MKSGDIVLLPFPFAELTNKKVRPTIVVCETQDRFNDLVVCAISSVVPKNLSKNEILLSPDKLNNLRAVSIIKVDRIFTAKQQDVIAKLGTVSEMDLENFKKIFKSIVE